MLWTIKKPLQYNRNDPRTPAQSESTGTVPFDAAGPDADFHDPVENAVENILPVL
jgi:hypothetical protein